MTTQNPDPETQITAARVEPELARTAVIAAIERRAPLPHGVSAEEALAATMCALSQRLSQGKAIRMELGLPKSLVPFVAECIAHRDEGSQLDSREDFLQRIASHLGTNEEQADEIATVVLGAVQRVLPMDQVDDIPSQLPEDLRDYWKTAQP